MDYRFTPLDAQEIANDIAKYFKTKRYSVEYEEPFLTNVPYVTTLIAKKRNQYILMDAQKEPFLTKKLKELASYLSSNRCNCELNIVTYEESDIKLGLQKELRKIGIGIIIIDDNKEVTTILIALNPSLKVNPEPSLKYGEHEKKVQAALEKYNYVNRKDGLRDMVQIVEAITEKLLLKASKKGLIILTKDMILKKDWDSQINSLGSSKILSSTTKSIISSVLKNDLIAFKGARNLINHKTRSNSEERALERQFPEKMIMGPRLVHEIRLIQRKI